MKNIITILLLLIYIGGYTQSNETNIFVQSTKKEKIKLLLDELNAYRDSLGLDLFILDKTISKPAQQHAEWMSINTPKTWSHEEKRWTKKFSGVKLNDRVNRYYVKWTLIEEIVSYCPNEYMNHKNILRLYKSSPPHHEALVGIRTIKVGIGVTDNHTCLIFSN